MNRNERLQEQFENAEKALLMDEYAEAKGEQILKEFEKAKENGEAPAFSDDLDAKCQKLIRQAFLKRRLGEFWNQFSKKVVKAAAVILILAGMASITIVSVDAFRIPAINFLLEYWPRSTTIVFGSDGETGYSEGTVQEGPLAGLLPDSYFVIESSQFEDFIWSYVYENDAGNSLYYSASSAETTISVDTENAVRAEEVKLLNYNAFFVEKEGYTIIWANPNVSAVFTLYADGMDYEQFIQLAEDLAGQYDK